MFKSFFIVLSIGLDVKNSCYVLNEAFFNPRNSNESNASTLILIIIQCL